MTVDICMPVFLNYMILDYQFTQIEKIFPDFKLFICDSTPWNYRILCKYSGKIEYFTLDADISQVDGEIHGRALDALVRRTTSPVICIMDTDFFWLKPSIVSEVLEDFKRGVKCVGCAGWYPDWQKYLDKANPQRQGHMAPVCWGMFINRELALSETFVVTREEADRTTETGWRLRRKIIEENIPCKVYPGFKYPDQEDTEICYFGTPEEPVGAHLLRGSGTRMIQSLNIKEALQKGDSKWGK